MYIWCICMYYVICDVYRRLYGMARSRSHTVLRGELIIYMYSTIVYYYYLFVYIYYIFYIIYRCILIYLLLYMYTVCCSGGRLFNGHNRSSPRPRPAYKYSQTAVTIWSDGLYTSIEFLSLSTTAGWGGQATCGKTLYINTLHEYVYIPALYIATYCTDPVYSTYTNYTFIHTLIHLLTHRSGRLLSLYVL